MNDTEKVQVALKFMEAIRLGTNTSPTKDHPANAPLTLQTNGLCDMLEAILRDGDLPRALAFAEDMPMRFQMLGAKK